MPHLAVRTAFTLVELLIVIAVLGLLAALLFPAFSRARERARRTTCASNLHQLALACLQYSQDSDGTLPPYSDNGFLGYNGEDGPRWGDFVAPYVKSTDVFNCPSGKQSMAIYPGGNYFDVDTYSYGIVAPSNDQPVGVAGRLLVTIENTAGTLMLTDDGLLESDGKETRARLTPQVGDSLATLSERMDGRRHTGCAEGAYAAYAFNAAYVDGHVKWVRLLDTWDNGALKPWTIGTD